MSPARGWVLALSLFLGACATAQKVPETQPDSIAQPQLAAPLPEPVSRPPRLALVLGGGAVRGFAHVGVIKVLEAHGIVPDMVVGTSAGSVVGALYAAGYDGYGLQKIALRLEDDSVGDWIFPDRGFIKGEALQNFINRSVQNRPIEKLKKPFAAVATDLQSGEIMVFQRGNTGQAVRASSSVPGIFQPVAIHGREYVDGGLVSPIPVRVARQLGADLVIAVDISVRPRLAKVEGLTDILLQTFGIMGQSIGRHELAQADVLIRPDIGRMGMADFARRHESMMEGEKAAQAALPLIREKLAQWGARTEAGAVRH